MERRRRFARGSNRTIQPSVIAPGGCSSFSGLISLGWVIYSQRQVPRSLIHSRLSIGAARSIEQNPIKFTDFLACEDS